MVNRGERGAAVEPCLCDLFVDRWFELTAGSLCYYEKKPKEAGTHKRKVGCFELSTCCFYLQAHVSNAIGLAAVIDMAASLIGPRW